MTGDWRFLSIDAKLRVTTGSHVQPSLKPEYPCFNVLALQAHGGERSSPSNRLKHPAMQRVDRQTRLKIYTVRDSVIRFRDLRGPCFNNSFQKDKINTTTTTRCPRGTK
ncbi:hypothetical protein T265_06945 [Opisthorchis viverrini]|uniref:Uncharacterized protein n=1 Tax=Opisthorchis viverrini TaxID=6198 RepID=A0A074ZIS9_OPIVI|nr:hypothetical protein T265_06945 [Opisthorchis viverrini]KER25657.1 hypothetical protein T265_06945 [Opisthorchis viverrini]